MKKIIAAAIVLALSSTAALANYECKPNYQSVWDPYIQQYVMVRYPDICLATTPPPPQYYPEPYPEPYYNDNGGAEFFMGALIGGLTGYAIGNYNDNNNNNNYYYYNGDGHRYKNHRYRERQREWRREDRRENRRHHRQKNRNNP